jgi:dTDP-4-dehydrorhamnose reductase
MRIAVIGAFGQVGTDLIASAKSAGCDVLALGHADCDVTDRAAVSSALSGLQAGDAIVNAAAFHRTEECERRSDLALEVNAIGAQHVAAVARERGACVVFFSTDYVFDGSKQTPYVESDAPRPINAYGVSKLAGEMLVRETQRSHYVIRISSVFGLAGSQGKGGNFVQTMLRKAQAREPFDVVDDITMSPTYSADAADLLVKLLLMRAPFGTYHLANAGFCTWRAFANAIFELAGLDVRAGARHSPESPGEIRRPRNSALASERLHDLKLASRPWRDALAAYLAAKGQITQV